MFGEQHLVAFNYKHLRYLRVYNCDHKVVKINLKCVGIIVTYTYLLTYLLHGAESFLRS